MLSKALCYAGLKSIHVSRSFQTLFPPFVLLTVKDMYDYQGRSYLHVPQDVGVNLRSPDAPDKCYLPKKQIHVWSGHTKASGAAVNDAHTKIFFTLIF